MNRRQLRQMLLDLCSAQDNLTHLNENGRGPTRDAALEQARALRRRLIAEILDLAEDDE